MKVFFIIFLIVITCNAFSQKADDTQPMYGGVSKSAEEKEADAEFVKEAEQLYGSRDKAYSTLIDIGWKNILNSDLQTAVKKFNHAWLINPEHGDAYFGFSMCEMVGGKLAKSFMLFENGQKFDKDKKGAFKYYLRSSDYYVRKSDTAAVLNALSEALKLDSGSVNVYKKLANFANAKGDTEAALKAYSGIIRLQATDSAAYFSRGNLYHKIKKFNEANADFSKSINCSNKFTQAYLNRGRARIELGNYENALADFEVCLTHMPDNGQFYRFVGIAKMLLNDGPGACEAWKKGKKNKDKQSEDFLNSKCK